MILLTAAYWIRRIRPLVGILLLISAASQAQSGDRRVVTQPRLPPVCQRLSAGSDVNVAQVIQQALDTCPKGNMVMLQPSSQASVFFSGPLQVPSGVSLAIGKGALLKAIADPHLYDNGHQTCGALDRQGNGCMPFITLKHARDSGIYGQGIIDGQGGTLMTGQSQTWWQLAASAKNSEDKQNAPRLIQIDDSSDITLYQITLKNAPNFHVVINNSQGVTLWGITIATPATARNTDGVDPMGSTDVSLINSDISTGDDNVAIKAGNAPAAHISVLNNHFGAGHGMSIGSEINRGVSEVRVDGLTLTGTTNGLRIKSDRSRGGRVSAVHYQHVCMDNVENPIVMDTHYDPHVSGSLIPTYQDITFEHIRAGNGKITLLGYSDALPLVIALKDVLIGARAQVEQQHAVIHGVFTRTSQSGCP